MHSETELQNRRLEALRYALGDIVVGALNDPEVIEVRLNCDGKLWIDTHKGKRHAGNMSHEDGMTILRQVSSSLGSELSAKEPSVAGELPLNGERFQGVAPPVVEGPIFAIRKKAIKVFDLSEYIRNGVLTFSQAELLRKAISERKNILVVGATKSGKTTFCNALLHEIGVLLPEIRMLLVEDTRELQCTLVDKTFLRSSEWTTMAEIGTWILRLSPDSITVGEVRAGAPTLSLLKNWNTGHPGGVATVHANSAYEGLTRIDQLIQEVSANPMRELIGEAINVVVFLAYERNVRRVKEIISVHGYDTETRRFLVETIK
ncbi:MAG: P-type conjugative transfer ATPase TrbB [Pseudomonadota bacterium]